MKGHMMLFDNKTYQKVGDIKCDGLQSITTIACSQTSDRAAITSGPVCNAVFLRENEVSGQIDLPEQDCTITATAFSPTGRLLVIGTESGKLSTWKVVDDKVNLVSEMTKHTNALKCIRFSPTGNSMVTCADFSLRVFATNDKEYTCTQKGVYFGPINCAVFRGESTILVGDTKGILSSLTITN